MPRTFRNLPAVVAAALLLVLTAGPTSATHQDTSGPAGTGSFAPVVGQLDGRTGPELLADSFVADYLGSVDPPQGDCQRLGRHDRVVWLATVPICLMRPGEAAVALIGASCSDVEPPPFFAVGEAAQRACARDFTAGILSITLAVDGSAPVEIIRPEFAVAPPQRHIVIPADNTAGFPAGPATFTADGWAAALQPVSPGQHTVGVVATFDGLEEPVNETFTLVVSPPKHS